MNMRKICMFTVQVVFRWKLMCTCNIQRYKETFTSLSVLKERLCSLLVFSVNCEIMTENVQRKC